MNVIINYMIIFLIILFKHFSYISYIFDFFIKKKEEKT